MHSLAGIYAAAVTPLKPDYSLDLDALPLLLDFLAGRGCHGALLCGTTGEGPSLSAKERTTLWRAAAEWRESHPSTGSPPGDFAGQRPDFRLLAGTGSPSLSETIELNRTAFELGFEAVVTLPPYYYRKATDDGLFSWFEQVMHRSVPADGFLFGYHFPGVAGIGFSVPLLAQLKESFPAQFAGIKDSSHDPDLARDLGDMFADDLLVLTGTDDYLTLALDSHAGGCITAPANLLSPGLRAIWDARQRGDETASLQGQVSQQRHLLEQYPPFPPVLKALLHRLHGLPRWSVRPPLMEVPEDVEYRLATEMQILA
jgi:4-hydroxy-tetrahydrodipicolinate synthase